MKKILLIGTGGTIASDVTEDGLAPELTSEQLLNHLPAISSICDVECIQLLNLDSCCFANKLRKIFIQSAKKKRRLKGF